MRPRRIGLPAAAAATSLLLGACADAPSGGGPGAGSAATGSASTAFSPVTLTNCGVRVTVEAPPRRLVTLNQGATEVALALGLQDRMAGTAYLDDEVSAKYAAAYRSVPVLAKEYPTKEQFVAAKPDFAYAAYASAFDAKAIGTRAELAGKRIGSYLSPFGCPKGTPAAAPTFDSAWREITDVGSVFGIRDKAEGVVDAQRSELATVRSTAAGKGTTVLWYDSGEKTPFVGAGKGGPQLVMDAVGARNVFAGLPGGWADGSWEKVVAADPDVIVLADASWSTADAKKKYLRADPVLRKLTAVKRNRFVVLPFSETTPGVRLVDGAKAVSDQLTALPAT
ncbi:ABC transporter substrate-binding protein [Flexivirga sp. ID2601S]|uniref:ABC transporter substrate-binding protein n=1 Tax=Flexivirga aerilata TaxID=1656889 RepID=A0A849AFC1_9MICO|nr:ABC transporter substrate-binding protein [Flexivirga aerilata]NNG38533.1 ABC transporter substrate-binding protein [Flexivirga aerilata]